MRAVFVPSAGLSCLNSTKVLTYMLTCISIQICL